MIDIENHIYNTVSNQSLVPNNVTASNVNIINVYGNSDSNSDLQSNFSSNNAFSSISSSNGTTGTTSTSDQCCSGLGPRRCRQISNHWICSNRRYKMCGTHCRRPVMAFRPKKVTFYEPYYIIPPNTCTENCNDGKFL